MRRLGIHWFFAEPERGAGGSEGTAARHYSGGSSSGIEAGFPVHLRRQEHLGSVPTGPVGERSGRDRLLPGAAIGGARDSQEKPPGGIAGGVPSLGGSRECVDRELAAGPDGEPRAAFCSAADPAREG